jgi:hypothetical protein
MEVLRSVRVLKLFRWFPLQRFDLLMVMLSAYERLDSKGILVLNMQWTA